MGAGKTIVGQLLAGQLRWRFVDLDDRIRAEQGRDIAAIFQEAGEAHFRAAESRALTEAIKEIEHDPGCVLALGGGAFVQAPNVSILRAFGAPVVFLDAAVEELRRRCAGSGEQRPLYGEENQFRQLYESRRQGYMAADLRVDTTGKMPAQVAQEIARLLGADRDRSECR